MSIVINAGVGGNNTRALLVRVDTDVLSHRPSTVIMMVGTNDALNSGALVPLDEYCENLDVLVTRITNDGIRVLLATIAPFHLPALMTRHRIENYGDIPPTQRHSTINSIIRDTAKAQSVPLAEVDTVLSVLGNIGEEQTCLLRNTANSGVADGVHPTAAGYAMIAALMYQAIRDHRLPTDKIVCFGDSITFGAAMPGQGTATGTTYPARLAELLRSAPTDRLDGDVATNQ
jgi:lysophospholipase L1-like esterase